MKNEYTYSRKVIITNKYISLRNPPKNVMPEHEKLFSIEYAKEIPQTYYFKRKNIYINNISLNKFKYFLAYYEYWRMNDEVLKNKFKNFAKNFFTFVNSFLYKEALPIREIDRASWVIDVRSNQFFHWINDVLQRIQILDEKINQYPILLPSYYLDFEYIKILLDKLKINYLTYESNEKIIVKNLLITSHGAPSGNYNEKLLLPLRSRLVNFPTLTENYFERIWISRQNSSRRKIKNFEEVSTIIENCGFVIVELENLKFEDQISIVKQAKIIAGLHGAGLSHMIFSNNIKSVIEIRDENDSKNNCFFSLASALKIDYYYILANADGNPYNSEYTVKPDDLKKFLSNF